MAIRVAMRTMLALLLLLLATSAGARPRIEGSSARQHEFSWMPELAPAGPMAIIVSLPRQRVYVYRNGVRIGTSTISSGRPGYETPSGVYTILEKQREHHSNLYDDAPMPYMLRLSWGGLAMHAGDLPGYPASHGCVRLPEAFAERLFEVTRPGTVVVVASDATSPPYVVSPGLFSPIDASTGTPLPPTLPGSGEEWAPERSPDGPLTIVLGTADRQLVILRNAVEIGHSDVTVDAKLPRIGTRAFLLLAGELDEASPALPDRPALRWLSLPATDAPSDAARRAFESGQIEVPRQFARSVYESLRPGTTAIVTDEPFRPRDDGGGAAAEADGDRVP